MIFSCDFLMSLSQVKRLYYRDHPGPSRAFDCFRLRLEAKPWELHTHDFDEIFLVESGEGVHTVNGKKMELRAGFLTYIRSSDVHTFCGDGLVKTNFLFPSETVPRLAKI